MERVYTNGGNFRVLIPPIEVHGNFASVSGLEAEMACEEYVEGGSFHPIYLAKELKYSRIVLKRGSATAEPLSYWFDTVRLGINVKYPMIISMMDNSGVAIKVWTVLDTMPVKLDYGTFDAMSGNISLTTVELIHGEILTIM